MNSKKKLLAVLVAAAIPAVSAWSQELDRIILHSGDTIRCNVTELSSAEVKFRYPNESLLNVKNMMLVKEIRLASGRVIEGEKILPVFSEADWRRVIVTGDESLAEGLKYVATIKAKSSVWRSIAESESDKALVELKQEAARHQCHLAVLVGGYTRTANGWTAGGDVEMRANIYTYPFMDKLADVGTGDLMDQVTNRPGGSYSRIGYKAYRAIMDDIEKINEATFPDKLADISKRIDEYKEAVVACPDAAVDDKQEFLRALYKLDRRFANMCKKYNLKISK